MKKAIANVILLIKTKGDHAHTIAECPEINFTRIHYTDNSTTENGQDFDQAVYEQCRRQRPDIIVIWAQPDIYLIPKMGCLKTLSQKGFKVACVWQDSAAHFDIIDNMPYCYHVVIDDMYFLRKNVINIWTPFRWEPISPDAPRDIPVSFFGRVGKYGSNVLNYMLNHGIPVLNGGNYNGNQNWNFIEYESLRKFLGRSKIGLSFPQCRYIEGRTQIKGRVFETILNGALLVEPVSDQTNLFFEPGKEFITYSTPEEAVEKINYYLKNDRERLEITRKAASKIERYSLKEWWRTLLSKIPFGTLSMS